MSASPESLVLLASAGTGKTYRLSLRYLRLLHNGVSPAVILASTFTRKAAGEILGAILCRLAEACADADKRQHLAQELGLQEDWAQAEVEQLLRSLLAQLPQLNIRTLDSWFQNQASAASWELGLPLGWRLAEEVDHLEVARLAVEATVTNLPAQESLGLLEAMQAGKAKRSVLGSGGDILQEAAKWWGAANGQDQAWELLGEVQKPTADEEESALARIQEMPIPETKAGKPKKSWITAQQKLLHIFGEQDWKGMAKGGLLAKVFAQENTYYSDAIPREFLLPAAEICARHLLLELHQSNLALRTLAGRYASHAQAAKLAAGIIDYDDFPTSLAKADPELRERVAARVGQEEEHLLLDEFQDTNPLQWEAIAPLAEKAVQKEERSLFVVGDAKQSIYGFREGESRLLTGLAGWLGLPEESMSRNYRSHQEILDAVNLCFGNLPELFGEDAPAAWAQATESWAEFPEHTAHSKESGEVRVWQVHGERAGDAIAMRQATLERILALHQQNPTASLAVLVRSNKVIPQLIAELAAKGVKASGAGGNPLTDSRAVDIVLSLLQLADHPGDTAAWFHVATSEFATLLDLHFREDRKDQREDARRSSRTWRRRLLREGYGPFLEKLYREMKATKLFDAFNLRRFGQLVELGLQWDSRATLRPTAFAQMVRERRVADVGSSGVQIMTVHQSKGLAFDFVLLPIERTRSSRNAFIAVRPEARGAVTAVSRRPSTVVQQAAQLHRCSRFVEALQWSHARELHDMLCVLYVAMTRAKQHMEILLPCQAMNPKDPGDRVGAEEVLRHSLLRVPSPVDLPQAPEVQKEQRTLRVVWQSAPLQAGQPAPVAQATQEEDSEGHADQTPLFLDSKGPRIRPRWSPSSATEEHITGAKLLQQGDDLAMRRGSALHALFACVDWLPQLPTKEQLHQALAAMQPPATAEEQSNWVQEFQEMCQQANIVSALSKGDQPAELWRERPFAVAAKDSQGQNAILQGIYDRVVLWKDGEQIVSADILDYKTGPPPEDQAMPVNYRLQLEAYRTALGLQLGLGPESIRLSLLYLDGNCQLLAE